MSVPRPPSNSLSLAQTLWMHRGESKDKTIGGRWGGLIFINSLSYESGRGGAADQSGFKGKGKGESDKWRDVIFPFGLTKKILPPPHLPQQNNNLYT